MVTFGEILIGLGLIFGCLTGFAAFFGVFLNMNFLLSGAVSINPVIGFLALFLILAWRIARILGPRQVGAAAARNPVDGFAQAYEGSYSHC